MGCHGAGATLHQIRRGDARGVGTAGRDQMLRSDAADVASGADHDHHQEAEGQKYIGQADVIVLGHGWFLFAE